MRVPDPKTRRLSVMVVDDYPDSASSLGEVLAVQGFATRTASSGKEAMSAMTVEPADVLIIEPRTVGCGWEFTRRVAEMVTATEPLLVVYTSDATPAGRRAANAAGADLYLVKPGDPALLADVLREFQQARREYTPTEPKVKGSQPITEGPIPSSANGLAAKSHA